MYLVRYIPKLMRWFLIYVNRMLGNSLIRTRSSAGLVKGFPRQARISFLIKRTSIYCFMVSPDVTPALLRSRRWYKRPRVLPRILISSCPTTSVVCWVRFWLRSMFNVSTRLAMLVVLWVLVFSQSRFFALAEAGGDSSFRENDISHLFVVSKCSTVPVRGCHFFDYVEDVSLVLNGGCVCCHAYPFNRYISWGLPRSQPGIRSSSVICTI